MVDEAVQTVRSVIKPYKPQHLGPVVDVRALMREHRSSEWSA